MRNNYNNIVPDLCHDDLASLRKAVRENTVITRCCGCGKTSRFERRFDESYLCERCMEKLQ